jgi:hypothetical protein
MYYKKRRNFKKEFDSYLERDIELLRFIEKNNNNFNLDGVKGEFKCIYIDFYECGGRYRNSFMFNCGIHYNLFKAENFNVRKYCDFLNYIEIPNNYQFRKNERNAFKIYFDNFSYRKQIWWDLQYKIRYEYYEINDFFKFLFERYPDFYIINLEDIIFELIRIKNFIKIGNIDCESKDTKKQFCYIIKDCNTSLYKIGKSINPLKREKTLQSEKPTLKLVKKFKNNHESELHTKYKKYRIRGEWFKLTDIQLKYICENYQ